MSVRAVVGIFGIKTFNEVTAAVEIDGSPRKQGKRKWTARDCGYLDDASDFAPAKRRGNKSARVNYRTRGRVGDSHEAIAHGGSQVTALLENCLAVDVHLCPTVGRGINVRVDMGERFFDSRFQHWDGAVPLL